MRTRAGQRLALAAALVLPLCTFPSAARAQDDLIKRFRETFQTTLAKADKGTAPNKKLYEAPAVLPSVDLRLPSLKDPDVEVVFKPCRFAAQPGVLGRPFEIHTYQQLVLSSKSTKETILELGVLVCPDQNSHTMNPEAPVDGCIEKIEVDGESALTVRFKKQDGKYVHLVRHYGASLVKQSATAQRLGTSPAAIKVSWERGVVPLTFSLYDSLWFHANGSVGRYPALTHAFISALSIPGTGEQVLDSKVIREIHDLFFLRRDANDPDVFSVYLFCQEQAFFNYMNRRLSELSVTLSDAQAPARDAMTLRTNMGSVIVPATDNTPRSRVFSKILLNAYESRLLRDFSKLDATERASPAGKDLRLLINRVLIDRLLVANWDLEVAMTNTHIAQLRESLALTGAASNIDPAQLGALVTGEVVPALCPKPSPLFRVQVQEVNP
jgi:hypothetical protein